jgi:hypothetical protein
LGDTTVVCGVKAEIAAPALDRDGEGFLGACLWLLRSFVCVLTVLLWWRCMFSAKSGSAGDVLAQV